MGEFVTCLPLWRWKIFLLGHYLDFNLKFVLLEGELLAQSQICSILKNRLSSTIVLYLVQFFLPSILISFTGPALKHPHSIMLPTPHFTGEMVFSLWWEVLGLCHKSCFPWSMMKFSFSFIWPENHEICHIQSG